MKSDGDAQWERAERRERLGRLIRWGVALALMLFTYPRLGFFGPFLMLLGCILIAQDVAGFFSRLVMGDFWPRGEVDLQLRYRLAETLVSEGKFAKAEKEYEKIIRRFPNEVKPHVDMINIALVRWKDAERADKLFERGVDLLKDPNALTTLIRVYAEMRARFNARPV